MYKDPTKPFNFVTYQWGQLQREAGVVGNNWLTDNNESLGIDYAWVKGSNDSAVNPRGEIAQLKVFFNIWNPAQDAEYDRNALLDLLKTRKEEAKDFKKIFVI